MNLQDLLVACGTAALICSLASGAFADPAADSAQSTTQQVSPPAPVPGASQPASGTAQQTAASEPSGQKDGQTPVQTSVTNSPQGIPVIQITGSPNFFQSPAKVSDQVLDTFRGNPTGLLSRNPDGGMLLASETRGLVGSDVQLVNAVIDLAKQATSQQLTSLAAGLAQIVRASAATRPDIALYIQQQIVLANNAALLAAFNAALGDVQTAAFGGPGAGPAAAASGIGGGASAAGTSALSVGIAGAGAPSISRAGSSGFSFSTVSTTSLAITSVSPTRP